MALLASVICALGANPYLHLADDKPVIREFAGEEWDQDDLGINEKGDGSKRAPLSATVTTVRLETMPWGEVYRITFKVTPVASERSIGPYYLLVTDSEILQLSSADMDREIRVIRGMKKQPRYENGDVAALSKGALKFKDGLWATEITSKGDTCFRRRWHDGSGHFSRMVWRKGVGLVEVAAGQGAELTGYELKLQLPGAKK